MRRFFFGLVYISSYVSYVYLDQPHFSLVSDEQQKPWYTTWPEWSSVP